MNVVLTIVYIKIMATPNEAKRFMVREQEKEPQEKI